VIAEHSLRAIALVIVAACAPAAAGPPIECFDATATHNSRQTRAVFAARHCQGGGVTWAPILGALARRQGSVAPVRDQTPGWTGAVYTLNGGTRFSVDEEGDAARFCAADRGLTTSVRRAYERLNADAGELRRAMTEASALEMECLEADGTVPRVPKFDRLPSLPLEELAATRGSRERLKRALERQPSWCFPPHEIENRHGLLRFLSAGRVELIGDDGKVLERGSWSWPRDDSGDDRIEVVLRAALFHFNVGSSGRLGQAFIGKKEIIREDLIPGDQCPRAR
jgi:hypothetical protein